MQLAHHFENFPEMMTVNETAEFLRIPRPTVYYLINKGKLPAIRISGRWRVRKSEVEETLNLNRNEQSRADLVAEKAPDQCILVIEDDLAQQKLYSHFFKRLELDYEICASGMSGIKAIQNHQFDLVFLDMQLPDQPGDQVFSALKKLEPDLPVVVATGYPDSSMLEKILSFGPTLVIRKPLDPMLMKQAMGFHRK